MDRLVKLYDLPPLDPCLEEMDAEGVLIRTARPYEKTAVLDWIGRTFGTGWADECSVSFNRQPVSCHIATQDGRVMGFACHECTFRNYFGPIGVDEQGRGRGIGKALLLSSLHAMWAMGYAYAVIGGGDKVGGFYSRTVGAVEIKGSSPGIYVDRLKM